jgi:phosphatidylserine decarboxylase
MSSQALFSFSQVANRYGKDGKDQFNVTITTSVSGENLAQAWQLGWTRLYDFATQYNKGESTKESNGDRRTSGQMQAGFFIAFGVVGMLTTSFLVAMWLGYLSTVIGPPVLHWNRRIWMIMAFTFWSVSLLAGGFYGWLLVGFVFNVFWLANSAYYGYLSSRRRSAANATEYTEEDLAEARKRRQQHAGVPLEKIHIRTETGGEMTMPVHEETRIMSIKMFVEQEKDIDLHEQRLIHVTGQGPGTKKYLNSDSKQTLQYYGVRNGDQLYVKTIEVQKSYAHFPEKLGSVQKFRIMLLTGLTLLNLILLCILFYSAKIQDYKILDRVSRQSIVEFQPWAVSVLGMGLYGFPGFADYIYIDPFLRQITRHCKMFNNELPAGDREDAIGKTFIDKYSIDMSEYKKKKATDFSTVNQWFSRKLDQTTCPRPNGGDRTHNLCVRPLATPGANWVNTSVAIAVADARVVAFSPFSLYMNLWIKSSGFTMQKLLFSTSDAKDFEDGSLFVFRLSPQDYHRFHAPATGKVLVRRKVMNTILSVNADAAQSSNNVLLNDREVVIYETAYFGKVAQVFIGATCTGSITLECSNPGQSNTTDLKVGTVVAQGQDIGKFEFGGSCVVLVFQKNKIIVDSDILLASGQKVETRMKMGQRIGKSQQYGEGVVVDGARLKLA